MALLIPAAILKLNDRIQGQLPSALIVVDAPNDPRGSWFVDIRHFGRSLNIEWKESRGFLLTSPNEDDGYGVGGRELASTAEAAADRAVDLLGLAGSSETPYGGGRATTSCPQKPPAEKYFSA